jgi:hypothetical protein
MHIGRHILEEMGLNDSSLVRDIPKTTSTPCSLPSLIMLMILAADASVKTSPLIRNLHKKKYN